MRPVAAKAPTPKAPAASIPKVAAELTGSCVDAISQYSDWPTMETRAVVEEESTGNASRVTNNPETGDYSIGCFQLNLLGPQNLAAKYNYASECGYAGPETVAALTPWLQDPDHNAATAHIMWQKDHGFTAGWVTTSEKLGLE